MTISNAHQENNILLQTISPTIFSALSKCGKQIHFPTCIPFQASQSQKCPINATIGQITDGQGNPIVLAPLAEKFIDLNLKSALLYSPVAGHETIRNIWHAKHFKEDSRMHNVALPIVTLGVSHAISMAAELFFDPGDTLILPDLHWDNYDHIFSIYPEARLINFHLYDNTGAFNLAGLEQVLSLTLGKVHLLLNFPSNPSGYSPTFQELTSISDIINRAAQKRPIIVYCDDAYHGLVFDSQATTKSLFFELLGRSANIIPLKCDGITKELSFFGGRVGFLTFGVEKQIASILTEKCMGLMRARVGSPVSISQHLAEVELTDARHDSEVERLRIIMTERYMTLKSALSKPNRNWTCFPFNSGCFCLLKLRNGLNADKIRKQLIQKEGVGVTSQGTSFIRIAFCSLRQEDIALLIEALDRVCECN